MAFGVNSAGGINIVPRGGDSSMAAALLRQAESANNRAASLNQNRGFLDFLERRQGQEKKERQRKALAEALGASGAFGGVDLAGMSQGGLEGIQKARIADMLQGKRTESERDFKREILGSEQSFNREKFRADYMKDLMEAETKFKRDKQLQGQRDLSALERAQLTVGGADERARLNREQQAEQARLGRAQAKALADVQMGLKERTLAPKEQDRQIEQFEAKQARKVRKGKLLNTQKIVDRLIANDGGRKAALGPFDSSILSPTFFQETKDFQNDLQALQSSVFLEAVEAMRGLGTLTEREGAKVGAIYGALEAGDMSQDGAVRIFKDIKQLVQDNLRRHEEEERFHAGITGQGSTSEAQDILREFGIQ